uniref:Uncharacterized protein n=1 Tax=Spongospora subterranea TaxID=70186 RepID=A0A0H5RK55_9EUKA|eukprot:CRZ09109.1 hypothetical protein [Spongospora subterranea]
MLSEPLASGSWPQPLLGIGVQRSGLTHLGPRTRISRSSKIFLTAVIAHSFLVATTRLLTDIVWKLPAVASHGLLDSGQNYWFFICFIISAVYNVIFAFDAVFNESRPALFACIGSSLLLAMRSIIEFSYKESACSEASINWICIPGLIEVVCYQLFLIGLGLGSVITQMGFRFYRIVGADLSLREIYERYVQFVTIYRLNQQLTLIAFVTAFFFTKGPFLTSAGILFFLADIAFQFVSVAAVHIEDSRTTHMTIMLSCFTPLYLTVLLFTLAGQPFFFDGLMLFKVFVIIFLAILSRLAAVVCIHRLRSSYGQGFTTQILPKLNRSALALPCCRWIPFARRPILGSSLSDTPEYRVQSEPPHQQSSAADL